ncbi:Predicted transcriptional regulator, ArsR family [Brevibacterium sp. 239c]|uniref:helix-turn-helix domain-containing protein n=1 Tax=Brevibacterium sp. 239c TaxID=1965356 RepID=UPI000C4BD1E6|nr:helix-turn-helix domain-containing protein [Brevibacterium sp. 239c]SMX98498.1 Predicted transcriptional regulator, ArsR family [Brevibacterium sp. 239c]
MPRRVNDYRGLAEVSRVLLLGAVQEHPGSRLKELAEHVRLHSNTARDHLRILVEEGLVSLEPESTGSRGRPPMVYRPVADPQTSAVARDRIERARQHRRILHRLAGGVEAQEQASTQFDILYEHLDDSGMEPVADAEEKQISLVPCPHYRMVGEDRKVACGIHARLVRDILAQVPGPLELDVLIPYTTKASCQIRLREGRCAPTAPDGAPGTGQ